ncbi:hypothetical protein LNQ03_02020 [Klebsiella pneumoniae subsp. pneumoniae]|nr:hypothetical protein [Klebsiella pneumoniae subsp. pneumoniae]
MVGFLQARAVAGVERFHDGGYSRKLWRGRPPRADSSGAGRRGAGPAVTLSPGLQPVAEICYARIGQLFDLACDPRQVALHAGDLAQARPGLAPPGGMDTFEQAVRRGAGPAGERGDGRPAHRQSGGWLGRTAGGSAWICVVPDARGAVPGRPAGA